MSERGEDKLRREHMEREIQDLADGGVVIPKAPYEAFLAFLGLRTAHGPAPTWDDR